MRSSQNGFVSHVGLGLDGRVLSGLGLAGLVLVGFGLVGLGLVVDLDALGLVGLGLVGRVLSGLGRLVVEEDREECQSIIHHASLSILAP